MKVIIVLFLLIIFFLASAGFTYSAAEKRFDANLSNILLHKLSYDVRLSGIIDMRNPETQNINL